VVVVVLCDKVDGFVDFLTFLLLFLIFFPVVVLHGCRVFPLSVVPNVFVMGKTLGIGWFCTKKYVSVVHNFVCLYLSSSLRWSRMSS
jgi:hypothetical protein